VRSFRLLLAARAVRAGDVVGVQLSNVWQYIALELAIPDLGAVIMPLPTGLGEHEISWVMERTQPTLVVTNAAAGIAGRLAGKVACDVEELTSSSTRGLPSPPSAPPDPAQICEIALSSGTTGMPKLASLSAGLKQATFERFTERLQITEDDRILPMTPLTQGIGGMCLYCLRLGAALIMLREPHWTAEHCLETAAEARATVMVGVPTNVIRMLNDPRLGSTPLATVRATAIAGAPMPPEVAQRWELSTGIAVCSFYGSMDAGQLAVASPSDPQSARWTTVGRPHDRSEWTILDPVGQSVTPGEIGEICMRGDLVQERYWGEQSGPYSSDGWAHMGDLGFVDAAGYLHVVGRVKDIIIRGGTNINPYELESMLGSHPQVIDVCVVGRPDPELGEVPVAFVVARPGFEPSGNELNRFLKERGLARYKWPEAVRRLDELPLSGPGKVNRKSLRELAASNQTGSDDAGIV
jgi:long-chain acyl-CoA synthetase